MLVEEESMCLANSQTELVYFYTKTVRMMCEHVETYLRADKHILAVLLFWKGLKIKTAPSKIFIYGITFTRAQCAHSQNVDKSKADWFD